MGKDKVDLRILKTRKAIKEAFLTLVQTKGYERITIQDIAEEAMINRNTFYLHYVDKPNLMEKLCMEGMEVFDDCSQVDINELDFEKLRGMLESIFQNIKSNFEFFKIMLSHNVQPEFTFHLKEVLKEIILNGVEETEQTASMKVGLEYIVSGVVGVICLWVSESETLKVEQVIEDLSNIHFYNVLELFRKI